MRITCDVETSNRLCASLNMKGKGKPGRSQLSVGRKPGSDSKDGEVYIMICTKQDRNGTKYIVSIAALKDEPFTVCQCVIYDYRPYIVYWAWPYLGPTMPHLIINDIMQS